MLRCIDPVYVILYEPTSSGSQLAHKAHERMIIRNPTARTKDSKITAIIEQFINGTALQQKRTVQTLDSCLSHSVW